MNKLLTLLLLVFAACDLSAQSTPKAILAKSIEYHDPESKWPTLQATFYYTETRPTGSDRKTKFELDNGQGQWILNRNDEEIYEVDGNEVSVLKGEKGTDRGLMLRNYYLYLWGLPMKLKDKSTPAITQSEDEEVDGMPVRVLRVAYEKEVYYFSFDQTSGRMLQYRFYKDEEAGKGELITLEGEATIQGIRIPQKRSWYTLPEMEYLGTDILDNAN